MVDESVDGVDAVASRCPAGSLDRLGVHGPRRGWWRVEQRLTVQPASAQGQRDLADQRDVSQPARGQDTPFDEPARGLVGGPARGYRAGRGPPGERVEDRPSLRGRRLEQLGELGGVGWGVRGIPWVDVRCRLTEAGRVGAEHLGDLADDPPSPVGGPDEREPAQPLESGLDGGGICAEEGGDGPGRGGRAVGCHDHPQEDLQGPRVEAFDGPVDAAAGGGSGGQGGEVGRCRAGEVGSVDEQGDEFVVRALAHLLGEGAHGQPRPGMPGGPLCACHRAILPE